MAAEDEERVIKIVDHKWCWAGREDEGRGVVMMRAWMKRFLKLNTSRLRLLLLMMMREKL